MLHGWVTAVDHKKIGVMYMVLGIVMMQADGKGILSVGSDDWPFPFPPPGRPRPIGGHAQSRIRNFASADRRFP